MNERKAVKLKKDLALLMRVLKTYNLEELAEIRKGVESQMMEKLYGLKRGLSDSVLATEFAKKHSYLVVKNELSMGRYEILVRPPEHSTLKLDLHDESCTFMYKTKQIRVFFTFHDWKKITGL